MKEATIQYIRYVIPADYFVIPADYFVIPASYFVIPASYFVIPASYFVIPAQAGIKRSLDPRLKISGMTHFKLRG